MGMCVGGGSICCTGILSVPRDECRTIYLDVAEIRDYDPETYGVLPGKFLLRGNEKLPGTKSEGGDKTT